METQPYQPPLDQLLTVGKQSLDSRDWSDDLPPGVGPEHVPELIRMATDWTLHKGDSEGLRVWAPLHAWRALGNLKAVEAVGPLLETLDRLQQDFDEWSGSELPKVFARIGPDAVPMLQAFLKQTGRHEFARVAASNALQKMEEFHPEIRTQVVSILTEALEAGPQDDVSLNGLIICDLLEMKAVEAVPVIRRAFEADKVDEWTCGGWGEVRQEFGVERQEGDPPERRRRSMMWQRDPPAEPPRLTTGGTTPARTIEKLKAKEKAKRKQAKAAKKQNRRR